MTFREKLAKEHPEKTVHGYCPSDYGYEKYEKHDCKGITCSDCWDREIPTEKTYEEGLQDAWELALKYIIMGVAERKKIFHIHDCESFFGIFAPQEALAKLKAYEEEKEIKVGDVVYNDSSLEECTITHIDGNLIFGLYGDGSCGKVNRNDLKKTGRHIEIENLLEQIRGE